MSKMPFIDYLNMVDDLLEARYGITSRDVGIASIMPRSELMWLLNRLAALLMASPPVLTVDHPSAERRKKLLVCQDVSW